MKWFWVVWCDNTVDNPLVTDEHDFGPVADDRYKEGVFIDNWPESAWMGATQPEDDGDPDDVLQNHLGLLIFSSSLRRSLELNPIRGLQFLPVRVFRPNGQLIPGFSVVNILDRRPALDRTRSDFDVFPPDYFLPERRVRAIRMPVLIRAALPGCDVIRLEESRSSVYVSERFKDIFEKGRFTGLSFHEVETS